MRTTCQKTMNVETPTRAHATDASLDLYVLKGQTCLVRPGAMYTVDLGIRVAIPDGYYGQLVLRSSAGAKDSALPNGISIIDPGHGDDLKVSVTAIPEPVLAAARERIYQLIGPPLPGSQWASGVVDDATNCGQGGFGPTGSRNAFDFSHEGDTEVARS